MATLTPVSTNTAGEPVTLVAATSGGDTIACGLTGTKTTFVVANGSGSSITVTLAGAVACSQGSTHNVPYTVAANTTQYIVVPAQCINQTTGGVGVTYSAVTTVTVAAIQ